jgi:hypothetical protein
MNDTPTNITEALENMYDLGYKHGYDAGRSFELDKQIEVLKAELEASK